ncbi:hypothetical protein VC83_04400 [Pseudogymnoascus destructans]|uniref:Uncharacterized protein n=1 Tax=Pseudogymnoascus destructans TaxID=655981 RepID=A0A177AAY4_9PEZI|nr:uncharacterized protein VC83_04400 [Pseudogymnoascus destructans]OAF59309.1 hypothetical protein VC83_04400 [Pseudogymnoascus destructans]
MRVKTLAFFPLAVVNAPLQNPVPLANGAHGDSKVDWVTEWMGGKNTNSMLDPTAAVIVSGENAIALLSPTVTICSPGAEDVAVDAAEVVVELLPAPPPPPYCARANGNRESKSALLEKCIFKRYYL